MPAISLVDLAERVDEAARSATAIEQLSAAGNTLGLEDAYTVQAMSIERRLERGERLVGVKMGFTSRAKMVQMGLSDLIWGRLTDAMIVEDGGKIALDRFVHPRVEPEIAFVLARPLAGRITPAQAAAAVESVAPALEIIDSRYSEFKFDLGDVIADNASSSAFVLGPGSRLDFDIGNLGMVMKLDGKPSQIGSSAAILGHPLRALCAASRLAGEAGLRLEPGWIVMAGGATAAEPLRPAVHVSLSVQSLGAVSFHVD